MATTLHCSELSPETSAPEDVPNRIDPIPDSLAE